MGSVSCLLKKTLIDFAHAGKGMTRIHEIIEYYNPFLLEVSNYVQQQGDLLGDNNASNWDATS